MNENAMKCAAAPQPPQPQLRDSVGILGGLLDEANGIALAIEEKLYGVNQTQTACAETPCQTNTIQYGLNRSVSAAQQLLNRLDGINSRL